MSDARGWGVCAVKRVSGGEEESSQCGAASPARLDVADRRGVPRGPLRGLRLRARPRPAPLGAARRPPRVLQVRRDRQQLVRHGDEQRVLRGHLLGLEVVLGVRGGRGLRRAGGGQPLAHLGHRSVAS